MKKILRKILFWAFKDRMKEYQSCYLINDAESSKHHENICIKQATLHLLSKLIEDGIIDVNVKKEPDKLVTVYRVSLYLLDPTLKNNYGKN